jgi:hypothetical protein
MTPLLTACGGGGGAPRETRFFDGSVTTVLKFSANQMI